MELYALLRGDKKWTLLQSEDVKSDFEALKSTMKAHGFKVVRDEIGDTRVINPYTGECEVIYRISNEYPL